MQIQHLLSMKHPNFQTALTLLRPQGRAESGLYLVESTSFVIQALNAKVVTSLFCTATAVDQISPHCPDDMIMYVVGNGLMQKLVGTGYTTEVNAIAVVRKQEITLVEILEGDQKLILACENIQDPRNVGVLIRTAEAAGCAAIMLSADSAECYSRAAVRSTTGSITRLPVLVSGDFIRDLKTAASKGFSIVAGSAKAKDSLYGLEATKPHKILLLGNETSGLSEEAFMVASQLVRIPMKSGGPSSLNVTVAAGIMLFHLNQ